MEPYVNVLAALSLQYQQINFQVSFQCNMFDLWETSFVISRHPMTLP